VALTPSPGKLPAGSVEEIKAAENPPSLFSIRRQSKIYIQAGNNFSADATE
jgi:hypothetical protein